DVYCDLQAETCTGDNAVFQDRDSCLATCAAYPQDGAYDATDGNSVQCRIYHSSVPAAADPVTHCPHTSQAGGGVCGTPCEGYCSQVMANCDNVYDSLDQCMTVCAALPDGGDWNAVEGNSVQCRAYHASFPAVGDAATHCPHTGVLGGGVCGPTTSSQRCRFYCDLVEGRDDGSVVGACGDLYEDEFDCGVQCAEFERGAYDQQTGDNFECRMYAAAQAVANPEMWCDAASMQGGDVCIEQIADPCVDYCDLMMNNCPGYYPDAEACAATCALFPADGMDGDTEGNTVQCRTYHAGVAADDAALHCPHASSNGGGVCGDYCESYCGIVMQTCPDTYADNDTCLAECALFPQDGEPDAVEGDSVQCRTYHASFPAAADAATHCIHTTPSGGDFCGGYCDVYCNRMEANCPESYADRTACMNACAGFPTDGEPGALEGNSVQCRIYHASVPATMDAVLHCPHAGQGGGGVCGSECENYCELTQANCTEANAIYPAMDSCLAACQAMPTNGAAGTTEGNSVQCRTYHAAVAADDPALHCQHAGITGGGVCGANACESYCEQVTFNCTGENAQYADYDACVGGCVELNREGAWNATEGDSVQCRAYHASFPAAADPATHCPHAGAEPTAFCVDAQ
ncbi:MAG: hypothetical protein KC583_16825, partial [Myxococcales bacterium]|nr:hypothetical protein [Myxococcales bacterium]